MVTVEEASRIILSNPFRCATEVIPLQGCIGKVLAEEIVADRPFPPFDRVSMDGIAISFEAYARGVRTFPIEGIQAAGQPALTLSAKDSCIEAMTGSMLPGGTDTVIRYEDLTIANGHATVNENVVTGQNVHKTGLDASKSQVLLHHGMIISSAEVALLASVGKANVTVMLYPSAAVISTGDELVDVTETPLPHQIRKSNVFAIQAGMRQMGWAADVFHIRDNKEDIQKQLSALLSEYDVLVLSGGVSRGKFDFVPEVLGTLGVVKHFHQVSQRPGKPFWFGSTASGKTVFALPGNPVSTFLCFFKYVKPWMLKSAGADLAVSYASLDSDFSFGPRITYFLQVKVRNINGELVATPVAGGGSGDFANLKDVTGFIELPAESSEFRKGQIFPYIPFRQ